MNHETLTINFSNSAGLIPDEYWVRLEQIKKDETASLSEVAELVDDVFELNPCVDTAPATAPAAPAVVAPPATPTIIDMADISDSVKRMFEMDLCDMDAECNFVAQIKVIISKPGEQYTLRLDNGKAIKTVIVEEQINQHITVEDVSGIVLDYPVVSGFTASWGNSSTAQPAITRTGNTLNWGKKVSGSITVQHKTRYDLVDVVVYGVKKGADYEPGECRAICFYHGAFDELDIEAPEDEGDDVDRADYCAAPGMKIVWPDYAPVPQWITTITQYYCQCSYSMSHNTVSDGPDEWDYKISGLLMEARSAKFHGHFTTESEKTAAAQVLADAHSKPMQMYIFPGVNEYIHGGFIDCGETTQDIADPVFYEQVCCEPPTVTLPKCSVMYRKNGGGGGISAALLAEYKLQYGDRIKTVPISPKDGDCGITKYKQVKRYKDCCEDVTDMAWDTTITPDVIPHGSAIIAVTGGKALYTWTTTNAETHFNNGKNTITTFYPYVRIYGTEDFCGRTEVTVDDGCSTVAKVFRAPLGYWQRIYTGCPDASLFPNGLVPDSVVSYPAVSDGTLIGSGYKIVERVRIINQVSEVIVCGGLSSDWAYGEQCTGELNCSPFTVNYLEQKLPPNPDAHDTCLDYFTYKDQILDIKTYHGLLSNGAWVFTSSSSTGAYLCVRWDGSSSSGVYYMSYGTILEVVSLYLYEWRCA